MESKVKFCSSGIRLEYFTPLINFSERNLKIDKEYCLSNSEHMDMIHAFILHVQFL